jgi:hypothetical protein
VVSKEQKLAAKAIQAWTVCGKTTLARMVLARFIHAQYSFKKA